MDRNIKHTKNQGFSIPEHYFEKFEESLLATISDKQPEGSKIPTDLKPGFKVPDQYFTFMEKTLFARIGKEQKATKIISLFSKENLIYISGIAAMIAIIIIFWPRETNDSYNFETVSATAIETYISEENMELSDLEIFDLLDKDTQLTDLMELSTVDEATLLDYLSNQNPEDETFYIE